MIKKKKPTPPHLRRVRLVARGDALPIIALGRRNAWLGDMYVRLLDVAWWRLCLNITLAYLMVDFLFAVAYFSLQDGIENARPHSFADVFFFSVQTMATIGYGNMVPKGLMANLLVTLQALVGFGFFAVTTGLVFSKFSRPTSRVMFSNVAVICPYNGVPHLMLRLANERGNGIVDTKVQMVMLKQETSEEGHQMRRFYDLTPVRSHVPILRLTWTIMHAIDENSPLYRMSLEDLQNNEAEIIITLTGLDETLSQTIHARFSYISEEIVFNAALVDILRRTDDLRLEVNYDLFHQTTPLAI